MNTKIPLLMLCAVLVAGRVGAVEPEDPAGKVQQFIDAFNKGDLEAAAATHVAQPIIIDEVLPSLPE